MDLHTHLTYTELDVPQALTVHPAHAALRGVERLHAFIGSGITSVRDTSSFGTVPFILKEWVRDKPAPGPAGLRRRATDHRDRRPQRRGAVRPLRVYGAVVEASGADGFREAVREQFKRGADLIKVASHFSREEIAAAVDEAHTLGLRITVDSETVYTEWAVEAGVDAIEHPLPRTDEVVAMMAQRGIASVPTVVPYDYIFEWMGSYHSSTSRDSSSPAKRPRDAAKDEGGRGPDRARHRPGLRLVPRSPLRLHPGTGGVCRVLASPPPKHSLAATRDNARILGMDDKLGTLEPGKLADVLVVEGNPLEGFAALANVAQVFRDGYWVVRDGVVSPHHRSCACPRVRGRRPSSEPAGYPSSRRRSSNARMSRRPSAITITYTPVSPHAVDDPVRLEEHLPVFPNPQIQQFPRVAAAFGEGGERLKGLLDPLQHIFRAGLARLGGRCSRRFLPGRGRRHRSVGPRRASVRPSALPKPRDHLSGGPHLAGFDLTVAQRQHLEKGHALLHPLVAGDVLHDGLGFAVLGDDQRLRPVPERADDLGGVSLQVTNRLDAVGQ